MLLSVDQLVLHHFWSIKSKQHTYHIITIQLFIIILWVGTLFISSVGYEDIWCSCSTTVEVRFDFNLENIYVLGVLEDRFYNNGLKLIT